MRLRPQRVAGIDNDVKIWELGAREEPIEESPEARRREEALGEIRAKAVALCERNMGRRFRTHRRESPFFSLFGGYYGVA